MKILLDFLPIILFFVVYKIADLNQDAAASLATQSFGGLVSGGVVAPAVAATLWATLVAILVTVVQVAWLLARRKRVEPMLWMSLVIIVLFGGATLWLQNETFIKWKPTVLYWLFALVLLLSQILMQKNLIQALMQSQLSLPSAVWKKLNLMWASFFLLSGFINLYVAYAYSTQVWVNFKLFGLMSLTVLFALAQAWYISRHLPEETTHESTH